MDLSSWYLLQFHQIASSPYLHEFAQDQWLWIKGKKILYFELGEQIDIININRSNYTCTEDNSNSFMLCMENYYSRKLGCMLPRASKTNINNDSLNLCEGKEKFQEFRRIALNILKLETNKELINECCFLPNCLRRSWTIKNRKEVEKIKNDTLMTGFVYDLPQHTKVLVREEVQLYTLINFFGEVGGYLGLLLGESLISYLIITSNWVQILGRKLKARCRKAEKEPESPPA